MAPKVDDFEDEESEEQSEEQSEEEGEQEESKGKDEESDLAKAKRQLAITRKAEKSLRSELKELKAKDLPEKERLEQERKDLAERTEKAEARLRKAALKSECVTVAAGLGFKDPALAARLIDGDDVEWDDDEPTNVKALLKEVLDGAPYLKGRRTRAQDDDEDDEDEDAGQGRRRKAGSTSGSDFLNRQIRKQAAR